MIPRFPPARRRSLPRTARAAASVRYELHEEGLQTARVSELLALALWQLPPWIVVGFGAYAWLIARADLTLARLGLFAAVYAVVRVACRLTTLAVLLEMGVIRRSRKGV